jgi:PAS domain S-box-containing protein
MGGVHEQSDENEGEQMTKPQEYVDRETSSHKLLIKTIEGYLDDEVDDDTVREAYERITDGFFSVDSDWSITYINGRAARLLNREDGDVLGDCLWDTFPETRGTVFYEKAHEAVEQQRPVSFDGYYEVLDVWFHVNAYPSEDGLSVYFRDVTEEVERKKELERHGQIVESCPDALWMFSADLEEVLFVNSAYEDVLGQSIETLKDNPTAFVEATHPDDRDLLREKMHRAKEGRGVDFEVRVNPEEGYGRHVWARGQPVYEDGELVAVCGFTRDITERVERRHEIRKMKKRLDLAVESGNVGVWDWDVETGRVAVDENWNEHVGRGEPVDEIAVEDWESLVHTEDLSEAYEAIEEHFEGETEEYDVEFRMRNKDEEEWRWIRSVGRVVERDEDGEPQRAVGVHIDIDDRKRNEAALERRNRYLRRIQDASQRMLSATTREEVERIAVESSKKVFDDAEFYRWDDGFLRSENGEVGSGDGSPAWEAFSRGELMVTDIDEGRTQVYSDVSQKCSCDGSGEDVPPRRLDAPVGDDGVLAVHIRSLCVCDTVVRFVNSVTTSAETSLERIENERELQDAAESLRERNDELRRLSEINDVVRSLIKKVVDADSQEEIRRTICEQLLEVEGWEYTWFAEEDGNDVEATCCSDEEFTERLIGSLDGSPLEESLEDGEVRVVDDIARTDVSDWRRTVLDAGYLSAATVPVRYGSRRLGVLEVYSSQTGSFDGKYSEALVDAAKIAGYAITASEQMDAILSGGFERLTVRIDQDDVDCVFSRFVEEFDQGFRINAVSPGDDGTLVYFRTDVETDELRSVADEMGVELSETMNGYGATVSEMSVVDKAMDLGGRVSRYGPGEGSIHVDVDLPQGRDARDLLEAVSDEYPTVELVARKSNEKPELGEEPLSDLTERQRTVLRLAYESGFFETPREKTGQELADTMGITATTFHQHLRSAEEKMVDAVLDTD